jgi:hypothetical protein
MGLIGKNTQLKEPPKLGLQAVRMLMRRGVRGEI